MQQQTNARTCFIKMSNYEKEIKQLKKTINSNVTMKYLFNTKNGLTDLIKLLEVTKIATKRWLLEDEKDQIDKCEWKEIENWKTLDFHYH